MKEIVLILVRFLSVILNKTRLSDISSKRQVLILIFVLLLISSFPAAAEYYRFIDEKGNVVFTDNLSLIPENQREKALRSDSLSYQNQNSRNPVSSDSIPSDEEMDKKITETKFKEYIEKQYKITVKEHCPTETRSQLIKKLETIWNETSGSLKAGNHEAALMLFSVFVRDEYRRRLSGFSKKQFNSIFGNVLSIELDTLNDDNIAECSIIRDEKEGRFSYPIRFVRDPDCEWRVNGF